MGALPYAGGVGFRVWAPFAQAVAVVGEFNGWSGTANPLTPEASGYWSTDVPGAAIGQRYKFVLTPPGGPPPLWHNDPYAREMSTHPTSAGGGGDVTDTLVPDSAFDWSGDTFQMPPWNEIVVYELHIGTYNDTYAAGPGTFQGVIDKLPYLSDLGINLIEIMAAGEFYQDYSWGYNPAYIYAIEEAYGGLLSFRALVREAHRLGIGVIFDVVYNHLGTPAEDMWQFDGWSENGKGGIYFYNDGRSTTPWGETRLDFGRGEVRQYLRDNALNWLEGLRVDGLRWDSASYTRNVYGRNDDPADDIPDGWSLMQWINDEIDSRQPWKIRIAEDLHNNAWLTKPTGAGGAGFDAQWDAAFVYPLRQEIARPTDDARSMQAVRSALEARYNDDAFQRVIYVESHDEVSEKDSSKKRLPEQIWPGNATGWFSRKCAVLGAALVLTAPGIPMLFQGQEWLEWERFDSTLPLHWERQAANAGIGLLFRDLIRLRRNWYDQTRGLRGQYTHVHHVNDTDKLVAFHRWQDGGPRDDVVVIANFADRSYDSYTIGFPRAGLWKVRFNSDWSGYASDFGSQPGYDTTAAPAARDEMPCQGNIGIGPYSVLILSQDA
jgi:1,4-alpha-glucan branching enzyme